MSLERDLADYGQHLRRVVADVEVPVRPGLAVRPLSGEPPLRGRRWLWAALVGGTAVTATLVVLLWPGGPTGPPPFGNGGSTLPPVSLTTIGSTAAPTTVPPSSSTSTTGPGASGRQVEVFPASGRPGEPLVICGYAPGSTGIRVVFSQTGTWYSWPDEVDGFTTADESGRWCWTGTIPRELVSTDVYTMGERRPITSGLHEIRADSSGNTLGYARFSVVEADEAEGPSQAPDEARRDGVVPAMAELPFSIRVKPLVEVPAEEGTWVLAEPTEALWEATAASGCRFGDTDGDSPEEVICTSGYGEILLVDRAGAIVRAYPMPGAIPSWIHLAPDFVYAGHVGDGAYPDSTLVRIDRTTLEAGVVLIPAPYDGGSDWPASWRIATDEQVMVYRDLIGYGAAATGTETTSWIGRVVIDLGALDGLMAGSDFGVERVDLVELLAEAPAASLLEQIRLPWGDEPGQAGYSADFGPCCLAVTTDGLIVVMDGHNQRLQSYDGSEWRVFYEAGGDRPAFYDGIAALGPGLIAVPVLPPGNTMLLLDPEGSIVAEGRVRREANNGWWGGEDVWAVLGSPPYARWVRVTRDGSFIPFEEQEEVDSYSNGTLAFRSTYDGRGREDPAHNLTTVTIEMDGESRRWILFGGEVAGGGQFTPLADGVAGLWRADGEYLLVTLQPDRAVRAVRLPRSQWVDTGAFDFFQVGEDRIYLLQTYPDGARVEAYWLP